MTEKKAPSQRTITRKATKTRRDSMRLMVLSFNIQNNKLSLDKYKYLTKLCMEAKYFYNYLLNLSQVTITDDFGDLIYSHNLFQFNTKSNHITVFDSQSNTHNYYKLQFISSQMKQEILKKIQASIKSLAQAKKKGRKVGRLKFKSTVNVPLKQFNNSFYLSDDCKKLSLQGNSKAKFHLVRNKNLTKLAKSLLNKTINNKDKDNLTNDGFISLKKLIDLNIIEVANAELQPINPGFHLNDFKFKFNLTVYFNKQALKKAQLFQGAKLSKEQHSLLSSLSLGIDAGIGDEITLNVEDKYESVSLNSRKQINDKAKIKLALRTKYQQQLNKHINKTKKRNKKNNSNNNAKHSHKTNKYNAIKAKMNKQDDSIVNHKIDSVNKLMSIINACKAIHFQNELIAKWHKNKKMKFSGKVQKGILGKLYAKLALQYEHKDNDNYVSNDVSTSLPKYVKLGSGLRTTKTCVCGKENKHITIKDRVYVCICGYKNHRDTHSSYIMTKTINHMKSKEYKAMKKAIESNMEEKSISYEVNLNIELIKKEPNCGIQFGFKERDEKSLLFKPNQSKSLIHVHKRELSNTQVLYKLLCDKLSSQNLQIGLNQFVVHTIEASSFWAG